MSGDGVLLLHNSPVPSSSDLFESVRAFRHHSRFAVNSVNLWLGYPQGLDRARFAAIVLHYSMFYSDFEPLSARVRAFLSDSSDSFKVAFFQDEQAYLEQRLEFCARYGIDCIYTCVESPYAEQLYGSTGASRIVSYLPAYVSDRLRTTDARWAKPDERRPIDIGYRGRKPPESWGGAAREKYEIAVEFQSRAGRLGLVLDIETDEDKRLYGRAWPRFVGRCKGMLGAESGAIITRAGGREIPYRTIGPRHFEAAALRTCQILYEGRYSCVLEPAKHYLPLKKDFSNFEDVIAAFGQPELRRRLTTSAYEDLIESDRWTYGGFVRGFDEVLADAGVTPPRDPVRARKAMAAIYPSKLRRRGTRLLRVARARARLARSRLRSG